MQLCTGPWVSARDLCFLMDVALPTTVVLAKDFLARLPGGPADQDCRLCGSHAESLGPPAVEVPNHEHKEYQRRHDAVLFLLVKEVAEHFRPKVPSCLKVSGGRNQVWGDGHG